MKLLLLLFIYFFGSWVRKCGGGGGGGGGAHFFSLLCPQVINSCLNAFRNVTCMWVFHKTD
jgi:hypothetical protein